MERKRRREITLAVVAVALAGTAMWGLRPTNSAAPAGQSAVRNSSAPANKQRADKGVSGIDLQALESERPEPERSNRNPFRFKQTPSPSSSTPAPRTTTIAPPPSDHAMTSIDPGPPRIPLKFIGVVEAQQDPKIGRVAILSDTRGVYHGRENDTIEGRYRILKIGVESVDLAYLDGRGRQTIRLTGQ